MCHAELIWYSHSWDYITCFIRYPTSFLFWFTLFFALLICLWRVHMHRLYAYPGVFYNRSLAREKLYTMACRKYCKEEFRSDFYQQSETWWIAKAGRPSPERKFFWWLHFPKWGKHLGSGIMGSCGKNRFAKVISLYLRKARSLVLLGRSNKFPIKLTFPIRKTYMWHIFSLATNKSLPVTIPRCARVRGYMSTRFTFRLRKPWKWVCMSI